jgi:NitT/TauT family transport system ATP-binding protein
MRGVTRRYGRLTPVFEGFDWQVRLGQVACVVGASGCGKSTLIRLVAGLDVPQRGSVNVLGVSVKEARRAGRVALSMHDPGLLPWRSVEGNIRLGTRFSSRRSSADVLGLLQAVHLEEAAKLRPHQLSSGMRQRVSLARALAAEPDLLLLDEPMANVDEITRADLLAALQRLWLRSSPTTVLVTHSIEEAVWIADEVFVMAGRPASMVGSVPVRLERPRSPDLVDDPSFRQLTGAVRDLLRH